MALLSAGCANVKGFKLFYLTLALKIVSKVKSLDAVFEATYAIICGLTLKSFIINTINCFIK